MSQTPQQSKPESKGTILVDLDHTLATYENFLVNGASIGEPVDSMVRRVHLWLAGGYEVRIFTARANVMENPRYLQDERKIKEWCTKYIGVELPVTCKKDFSVIAIWDNFAVPIEPNTGRCLMSDPPGGDPLAIGDS